MAADNDLILAVGRMKNGEEEGFNLVYSKTYNFVYFRARQIMKDEEDALDLLQIVYVEAYKSIETLDKPENIYAWLGAITYRQGMKIFRKKNEILLDEETGKSLFESIPATDVAVQPEASAENKEVEEILSKYIDELPEAQRTVVIAYYYDGIGIDDIADIMECSPGTVKSRLNYARKFLKKKLDNEPGISGSRVGAMAISGAVIFGAIQGMSEQTAMAATTAQSAYAAICGSVGVAAGTVATTAGMAAAGAGVSIAASSGVGAAAAAAGTVSAGAIAAGGAGSAAGTAATTATTATTAATAATTATAVTGTVATTKTVAVAVAVAVSATGVGTAVNYQHKNSVSSEIQKVDMEDGWNTFSVNSSDDDSVSNDLAVTVSIDAVSVDEISKETESASSESTEKNSQTGNVKKEKKEKKKKEKAEEDTEKKDTASENDAHSISDSVKVKIARSAASVLFFTGGESYDGKIDNASLDAAYTFGTNIFLDPSSTVSLNGAYIDNAQITKVSTSKSKYTIDGTFDYGVSVDGVYTAYNYSFKLKMKKGAEDALYEGLDAKKLVIKRLAEVEVPENGSERANGGSSEDGSGDGVVVIEDGTTEEHSDQNNNNENPTNGEVVPTDPVVVPETPISPDVTEAIIEDVLS